VEYRDRRSRTVTRAQSLSYLLAAFGGLSGLGLSSALLLQAQERQHKFRDRVANAAGPHIRLRLEEGLSLVRSGSTLDAASLRLRAANLFGFRPDRQARYPVRWWVVLGATFAIARVAAGVVSSLLGAIAYLGLIPLWIWLSRWFFRWSERRYADTLFRQFPDALAMIVRSVRIGIPVGESIHVLAREGPEPTAQEFKILSDQIRLGVPLDEALVQLATNNDLREYRFFATALSLQRQAGGGLTETLENLADVIRKRVAARSRARALASEANTSAAILSAMPVVTGLGLWVINPGYIQMLFSDRGGQRLLALAAILLGTGIAIMRWLIRKTLS
jgi:tight adherence protein B